LIAYGLADGQDRASRRWRQAHHHAQGQAHHHAQGCRRVV